jgi:hypothetical protein
MQRYRNQGIRSALSSRFDPAAIAWTDQPPDEQA